MPIGQPIEQLQYHINCQQLVINDLTTDLYNLQDNPDKAGENENIQTSLYQPSYSDSFKMANASTGFSILDDTKI